MLIENITFLRGEFPEVRKYFLDHEKELHTELVEIMQAKSGVPTAGYQVDGKELMVHSAYDPVREAERIINSHAEHLQKDTHVMFFGIGMGYHIETFQKQYPDLTYSIYEPLPEMFFAMSKLRQLGEVFSKRLNGLYIDQATNSNLNYLQEFQSENRGIHIIVLPSYENIAKGEKEQFFKNIKDSVQSRRSEIHTNTAFQKLWVMNSIKNFNEVLSTPNIMLDVDKEQFKDKPAIIVSAGPSLAEDIEHIRYIKDNSLAYICSVGSAINALLSYEIIPDAVFTYDPKEKNYLAFEKMINMGIVTIPMVFGSSVGYETLNRYNGPKVHFVTTQDRSSLYFLEGKLDVKKDLIVDSPSVAVMTFQILNRLGANPIIFAGQNLGYLYGRQYSKGVEYKHISSEVNQRDLDNALLTTDVYGNKIKTTKSFNDMRTSIEAYALAQENKTLINTTKGGAEIKGVPFKPLEQVINEHLGIRIEKQEWWLTCNQYETKIINSRLSVIRKSNTSLKSLIDELPAIKKMLSNSIRFNNKYDADHALVHFDKTYNSILDNVYYKNFLSFYLRVYIKYVDEEIRRLNRENDIFEKAIRLNALLENFIKNTKKGLQEMSSFFEKEIKY